MKIDYLIVILNLVMSVVLLALLIKIVFRTEKGLDKAFKLFMTASIFFILAMIVRVNNYLGILPDNYNDFLVNLTGTFALIFFIFGSVAMLHMIKAESRKY